MRTITLHQASADLKKVITKTIRDHDQMVIASEEGSVVVMEEQEWSHIKETLRLLSDKESLAALLNSHAIRDRGEKPNGISPEKAFLDV